MPTPQQRIAILQGSLRCFVYGATSVIPVIGAGLAVASFRWYRQARAARAPEWNPARYYLRWGVGLACLGAALTTIELALVGAALAEALGWL